MRNQPRNKPKSSSESKKPSALSQKWKKWVSLLPIGKWQNFHSQLPQYLSFVLFLLFWGLIYIGNRHSTERRVKQNYHLSEEVKELRAEYLSIKADLMFLSKQSEIAKLVKNQGLQEITQPPFKVIVPKKEEQNEN